MTCGPIIIDSCNPCYPTLDCGNCTSLTRISSQQADLIIEDAWNVPKCGNRITVTYEGTSKIAVGTYLYSSTYGYFQIIAVDTTANTITIQNNCIGNPLTSFGSLIPSCTAFSLVDAPANLEDQGCLPYLTADFISPKVGQCSTMQLTSLAGMSVGTIISLNPAPNYQYRITEIYPLTNTVLACNEGLGAAEGTVIAAVNVFGNYIVCVSVLSTSYVALCTKTFPATLDLAQKLTTVSASCNLLLINPFSDVDVGLFINMRGRANGLTSNYHTTPLTFRRSLEIYFNGIFQSGLSLGTFQAVPIGAFAGIQDCFYPKSDIEPPYNCSLDTSYVTSLPAGSQLLINVNFFLQIAGYTDPTGLTNKFVGDITSEIAAMFVSFP